MAVNIKLKRSAVPGKVPTVSSLELGEIALNTYDGRAFMKQQVGATETVVELATTAGSGSSVTTASYANYAAAAGSASFATSASYSLTATSASYASQAQNATSASFATSASNANTARSASYSATSSYADNFTVAGTLTAQTIVVQVITSSQELVTGSLIVENGITGSLSGTASYAINALQAQNAATTSYAGDYTPTSSFNSFTSSYLTDSGSFNTRITNNSASISSLSSSFSLFSASYTTGSFSGSFTGSFSGSLNNLQGNPTHIAFFSSSQVLASSTIYQVSTASIAINETNVNSTNPEALYVFQTNPTSINVISGKGNLNNYLQLNIQNTNQGTDASSDIVATANNGNEGTNYVDMGINSENFSGFIGGPNDAYVYNTGSNFHIGNITPGKHLGFFVGGSNTDTNNKLQLNDNNLHLMSGSLNVSGSVIAPDFTGSLFGTSSYAITASYAENAAGSGFPFSGSAIITGSLLVSQSFVDFSQASYVTGSFTGSLLGTSSFATSASQAQNASTASYVLNAISASFATTASHALNAISASFATSASQAQNAVTASYILNAVSASFATSASQAQNAVTASYVLNAVSSSFATSASQAQNATTASHALTASFVNPLRQTVSVSGSLNVTGSVNVSGSTGTVFTANVDTINFSGSINATGSVSVLGGITGSLFGTASFASTASQASTASSADNFTVRGTLTAQTIVAQTITSSTDFVTGSTRFGTLLSNTHQFTGSVSITGSLGINGVDYASTSASFDTRILNNSSSIGLLSGSFLNASSSFDTRITNNSSSISALSSSYLIDSASFDTRVLNNSSSIGLLSGSFLNASSSFDTRIINNSASIAYLSSSYLNDSSSFDTRIINNSSSIGLLSGSFLNASASFDTRILTNSSSIGLLSSSFLAFSASYNTGSFTGSFIGTASYAQNSDLLDGKDSSTFATTGSNIFIGNQTVTGSLFTSGSNTLVGITTLTGSLNITGSTTQIGNNNLFGNTTLSGSIIISGALGTNNPTVKIYGDTQHNGYIRFDPVSTNIDTSISASYIYVSGSTNDLYFSQNGSGYNNVTRLRWLEGNLYSGLLNGGLITTQSSTVYQISSGSGVIVNLNASFNDNPYPTVKYINWPNLSASIAPLSGSYDQTFVAIDANGQIYAQGTPYSDGQFNTEIPIGVVIHQNRSTINGTQTFASLAYGWKQRSSDFIRAFGPLKLSGLDLYTSSSRGLTVGSGTAWSDGRNYSIDPNNPSYITDPGTTVSKIYRYHQSGSAAWVYDTNGGAGYTTIDPTQYSLNGVLTSVGASNWSIQRVYWFPNSVTKAIYVYYGNARYATEAEAIANLQFEPFVEAPNTAAQAVYLGAVIINGTGVFTNVNDYKLLPAGLFRSIGGTGGGGSSVTTTLSGLSDVNISAPSDGQALVYNTTALKWGNKSFISASISGNAATATTASYASNADLLDGKDSTTFATTGSNVFKGLQTIDGNLFISGSNRLVYNNDATNNMLFGMFDGSNIYGPYYQLFGNQYSNIGQRGSAEFVYDTRNGGDSGFNIASFNGSTWTRRLRVDDNGAQVTGSLIVTNGITGSLFGTASWANNAINSSTASSADNFTVRGTLTAQTIVVQTITSSTDYVTGSTRFGSLLANTHQFTGSVSITGSLDVNGSSVILTNQTSSMSVATASYALVAVSASYASASTSASYALNATTASYALDATSASYALNSTSASYALIATTSSYSLVATSASYALNSTSASHAIHADDAISASYALNATSASYAFNSTTASFAVTAAFALNVPETSSFAVTSSYALVATSASYALNATSASFATTSSHVPNAFVQGGNSFGTIATLGTNDSQDLTIETNNSEVIRVTKDGDVGINTTNPGGRSLDVNGVVRIKNTGRPGGLVIISHADPDAGGNQSFVVHTTTGSLSNSSATIQGYYGASVTGSTSLLLNPLGGRVGINTGANLPSSASLQIDGNVWAYSYTGSLEGTASYAQTASYALNAGAGAGFPYSGSAVITGSFLVSQSFVDFSQATYVTGSFTGSLAGTASHALNVADQGYVHTQAVAAATWSITHPLQATTPLVQVYDSSYNQIVPSTVSIPNQNTVVITFATAQTGYAIISKGSGVSTGAISASYALNSTSASYAVNATSASYSLTATSASYALNTTSASYALNTTTAATASYANNFTVAGTLTAQTIVVQTITSSTDFVTGSTIFGSTLANTHQFTGSVSVTGSLNVNGSSVILTNQTSSMSVLSSSFASTTTSASFAATSSFANNFTVASRLTLDQSLMDYATVASSLVGSNNLFTESTGSYTAAKYLYTVASASNARTGEVMAVWNGANVQFTDNSTLDIGTTTPVTCSVAIVSGQAQFNVQTNTSGWRIKSTVTYL